MFSDTDAGESETVSAWPAFADLLAATTLLFLILFAAIAIPAIADNRRLKGKESTLQKLHAALDSAARASHGAEEVSVVGDYLLVRIPENATFPQREWDLASLKPEGREILTQFAARLRDPAMAGLIDQVQVVGHTSSEGTDELNWYLSARRAVTVALFLIQDEGLSPCEVTALGRGRYYPVDPALARRSDAPRASDRRIEIEVRPRVVGDRQQAAQRARCVDGRATGT